MIVRPLHIAAAALTATLAGCGARPLPPDLVQAEKHFDHSDFEKSLTLFGQVLERDCRGNPTDWALRRVCGPAAIGKASSLDELERPQEAVSAYMNVVTVVRGQGRTAARALQRAAEIELRELKHRDKAYALAYRVVLEHPDSVAADDALRLIVRDGTNDNSADLVEVLLGLYTRMAGTEIADNLLFEAAEIERSKLNKLADAARHYDELTAKFVTSGLRDDSFMMSALALRSLGRPEEAIERLRLLLATRRTAYIVGSYNSPFLATAAIEAGRIELEDRKNHSAAVVWFQRARDDNPKSRLRDDAQLWIATAYDAAGDQKNACAALARLERQFPDSGHLTRKGRELGARLGCTP